MLPHARRESADQFSFSSQTEPEPEGPDPPKAMEYGTWAEKIKGKYNYFGRPEDIKFGAWSRKSSANNDREHGRVGGEKSGAPSPEIWMAGKLPTVRSSEASPAGSRRFDEDRHISNGSRAVSIAKYRQEMLDLVRDVPENSYELSLIDIVEPTKITEKVMETTAEDTSEEETDNNDNDKKKKKKEKKEKKKSKKGIMRRVSRSESMESGGLMLKMFIPRMPVALGGKKHSFSKTGKVSPSKPSSVDGDKDCAEKKRVEGERWSKEFGERISSTGSSTSTSSSSNSTSSSTSSSSVSNRLIGSCYPFAHKGKSMGVED
ncbi:putative ena/VASP-like protein [Iris pallida]|uniref:Ena/VASP-like protein n=1 Tax=Iris pallida TaxID=29817 RepID=A0AAX6FLM5_IRIPA|nr:putative ena/VASP-like protein [Iris pallida]